MAGFLAGSGPLVQSKNKQSHTPIHVMSKSLWVSLLASAGYDQAARLRWHRDFERASPSQH